MKAIVVLGAAVRADGPSPALRCRCIHVAALWHEGLHDHIVVSGGTSQLHSRDTPTLGLSKARAMADELIASGVPAARITLEDRSQTTLENPLFARPILQKLQIKAITIVTDRYHASRAWLVARALGIFAQIASPELRGAHVSSQLRQYAREDIALPVYAVRLLAGRLTGAFDQQ